MNSKLLVLMLLLLPVAGVSEDKVLPSNESIKELEKVFSTEDAKLIDAAVRKQLALEKKATLESKCHEDIKKYRSRLAKDPGSEYHTWKLKNALKECGKGLNKKEYINESVRLERKQTKMLNEKADRQQVK